MYIVFIVLNIELKAGKQLGKHVLLEPGPQLSYNPFNDSILFYRLTSFWFIFYDKVVATIIFHYITNTVLKNILFYYYYFSL